MVLYKKVDLMFYGVDHVEKKKGDTTENVLRS